MSDSPTTAVYTAIFRRMDHAKSFLADLSRWDPSATEAKRTGRRVTFTARAGWEYYADAAEFVGWHGSPPSGPVATLNGHPTPRSY